LHCEVAGSQRGVAPEQSAFDRQPTQTLDPLHTGVGAAQSVLARQPTQTFDALHTGVGAPQSPFARQATHTFEMVSHLGAPGVVQSASAAQSAQVPAFIPVVTHAGPAVLPAQSALVAQGWQTWVVALQVGVAPLQSVSNSQATHVPVGKSQIAVPPMQADPLVDEHWPQAPQTSHAGVVPPQSASEAHGRHTAPLHTGVSPPQSPALRHCTQVLVGVQRGVVGGHWGLVTQRTQSPVFGPVMAHSGVDPPQSALLAQARHVRAVGSQIGVGLAQLASVRQPTHV
jgi:hypothetical protein